MKRFSAARCALCALGMLILILDSKTSLDAAREAVDVCMRTVVPSLLPFFMLSGILVGSLSPAGQPLLRPLGRLLGIPTGAEGLLIPSFLGGYPVGAGAVRDAWRRGLLDREDAQAMLAYCNNPGPAFLFGIAAPMCSSPGEGWALWGIQLLSALTVGLLQNRTPSSRQVSLPEAPAGTRDALKQALQLTAQVCGWVILFRIAAAFCSRWFLWALPAWARAAAVGLLELTNGTVELGTVSSPALRFLLTSMLLSFGGLCVQLQILSATRGLGRKRFFAGKLLQTLLSGIFALARIRGCFAAAAVVPAVLVLKKITKRGGNPRLSVV